MAGAVLTRHGFAPGTTVEAFLARARVGDAPPSGSAVDAAVVASDSTLTFDDLEEDVAYLAYAGGQGVQFHAQEDLPDEIEGPPAGLHRRVQTLERLMANEPLNAKNEGVFGLGLATEDDAWEALVDKAVAQGRAIYAPKGIYRNAGPIRGKSGLTILAEKGAVFRSTSLSAAAVIQNHDTAEGNTDITLVGLEIDGTKASRPGATGSLISMVIVGGTAGKKLENINVIDCDVYGAPEIGVQFASVQGGAIEESRIRECERDGIHCNYDTQGVRIVLNRVWDTKDDCIGLNAEAALTTGHVLRDLVVAGNILTQHASATGGGNIGCRGLQDSVVTANICRDGFSYGIQVGNYNTTAARGLKLKVNLIYDSLGYGIDVVGAVSFASDGGKAGCEDIDLISNTVERSGLIGIRVLTQTDGLCKNISLTGRNLVKNSGQDTDAVAIHCEDVENLYVDDGTRCYDDQGTKTQTVGLNVVDPVGNLVIGGDFTGNKTAGNAGRIAISNAGGATSIRFGKTPSFVPWKQTATTAVEAWTDQTVALGYFTKDVAITFTVPFPTAGAVPHVHPNVIHSGIFATAVSITRVGCTIRFHAAKDPGTGAKSAQVTIEPAV